MNLADPELEFIDPTPNVHSLFIHFDAVFFWTKLAGKAVVRWSKRMYSCAGICSYEGRGGICDIALSEPLLKLRPRKDLVETLLHEMIHAYLFVVGKDQSRNGHGPNFLSHMYRINQAASVNISVYHDFHDEVRLYQNHVWRCNGPCQKVRPFFGIVRRSMNKAPGPSDFWWNTHKRVCGGTFIKFKEPEVAPKPVKQPKKKLTKPNADITKYINNNNATIKNNNNSTPTIKDFNDTFNTNSKVESPRPPVKPTVFTGSGQVSGRPQSNSISVLDTVRNVWANKTLPVVFNDITKKQPEVPTNQMTINKSISNATIKKPLNILSPINANKRVSDVNLDSMTPPKKTKIDDYFKTKGSSILKDLYGKDFILTESSDTNKLKAVQVNTSKDVVECPICNAKVSKVEINKHIDECLNKDVIEKLSKETIVTKPSLITSTDEKERRNTIDWNIPAFKPKNESNNRQTISNIDNEPKITTEIDLTSNVQVQIKPSTSQDIDLTAVEIKPSTQSYIDLTSLPGTSKGHTEAQPCHTCPCCGKRIDIPVLEHLNECLVFFDDDTKTEIDFIPNVQVIKPSNSQDIDLTAVEIKTEPCTQNCIDLTLPSTSKGPTETQPFHTCPCCGKSVNKPIQEHLDECLMFFDTSTAEDSFGDKTVVIDDSDDEFDETQTFNATGTKSPCPCCMKMVEDCDMNTHLDICLGANNLM